MALLGGSSCNDYARQPFDLGDLKGLEEPSSYFMAWKSAFLEAEAPDPKTGKIHDFAVTGPFNFCISSRGYDDRRLEMEGFGLPLHEFIKWEVHLEDEHFRHFFDDRTGEFSSPFSGFPGFLRAYDVTSALESAVKLQRQPSMRCAIEIAYYLHPEELPFRLDPELFVIAAIEDNAQAMVQLLAADPSSLP